MILELKGAGCHNKGSEMMLLTLIDQLNSVADKITIVPKKISCEYTFYSKLGLYPKLSFKYKKIPFSRLGVFIPKSIRELFGIVLNKEVDVILDISGFAYSSEWGNSPTNIMAKQTQDWNNEGKKVILLPQAFGPFENETIRKNMKTIIDNSTLIFARDEFSYKALKELKDDKKIILSSDFTILFKGEKLRYIDKSKHQICIVPNQRMKDKIKNSINYEKFMANIISKFQKRNKVPFFLIFGGQEDKVLASKINKHLSSKIEIVDESNPKLIKGIIQSSEVLVGSRFHSIASALFSGIPAIGTGWSHKYYYFFKSFNYTEGLITMDISDVELDKIIDLYVNKNYLNTIRKKLQIKQDDFLKRSNECFAYIKSIIE